MDVVEHVHLCWKADQLTESSRSLLDEINAKIVPHEITLNYDYWTASGLSNYIHINIDFMSLAAEILHSILPESLREGSPTGFAATGHIGLFILIYLFKPVQKCYKAFSNHLTIAHLNLNDEYLPFKNIIGQVILDVRQFLLGFSISLLTQRCLRKINEFGQWSIN